MEQLKVHKFLDDFYPDLKSIIDLKVANIKFKDLLIYDITMADEFLSSPEPVLKVFQTAIREMCGHKVNVLIIGIEQQPILLSAIESSKLNSLIKISAIVQHKSQRYMREACQKFNCKCGIIV